MTEESLVTVEADLLAMKGDTIRIVTIRLIKQIVTKIQILHPEVMIEEGKVVLDVMVLMIFEGKTVPEHQVDCKRIGVTKSQLLELIIETRNLMVCSYNL